MDKDTGAPYSIDSSNDHINSEFVRLSVDLAPEQYIPRNATELSIMLVYSGTLGHEHDTAVAVGSHRFDSELVNNTSRLAFTLYRDYLPDRPPWLQTNIYTLSPGGDDQRKLTNLDESVRTSGEFTGYLEPAWSPDGRLLAFTKTHCSSLHPDQFDPETLVCSSEENASEIVLVDMTPGAVDLNDPVIVLNWPGTNYPESTEDAFAKVYAPSFSPDNRYLVCKIDNPWTSFSDLAVFDTHHGYGAYINGFEADSCLPCQGHWHGKYLGGASPAWSPDGSSIAYYYHRQYDSDEWVLPRDIYTIDPTIVFGSGDPLKVDGINDSPLTSGVDIETQPSWSPDSQWLVFTSDRDRTPEDETQQMDLWLMDRNGQHMRRIYNGDLDCMSPGFSPDGMRIVFRMGDSIGTVDLAGRNLQKVFGTGNTRDLLNDLTWSPYLDEFAPTVTLEADTVSIAPGETVTLAWSSTGADRIVLDNGLGEQAQMDGDIDVSPTADTTYTVTAYNWAGKATARVSVTVE